ncbi:MAG: STAS domain-containing protein [Planctomycetes bacterium]|nr:STAS domain-containing protein [Planctomycetota bacterium]
MTDQERLLVEPVNEVTVITFRDKKILDEAVIQEVGDALFDLVDKQYKTKLLLNFENVEYLSSAALGKLITLNKRVKEENGELKLCNIISEIYEVFRITKLNRLFEIYDDMEQALRRFKRRES